MRIRFAKKSEQSERGAALVSTLLISALLLTAGGVLILTTATTGTNTVDAAAEMQAYYGAEAGIQATLNVLRGGVLPSPLFVANPPGTVAIENRIDFTKALKRDKSNLAGDPVSTNIRLSRWLGYNFQPTGVTYKDRVTISPGYTPMTGVAYSIRLIDPDGTNLITSIPKRMIVESTGYGPRGSRKVLSMLVSADGLDIEVPAALVIRGADSLAANAFVDLGNSNAKTYSGHDNYGGASKPTLAVSGHDVATVEAAYAARPNTVASPKLRVLELPGDSAPNGYSTVPPPWFLRTANDARSFLAKAEVLANSCAAPGSPCVKRGVILNSLNGSAGAVGAPQFTIVKGDCHLVSGAGLLIVTGTLYFDGPGPNFDGIILVMGAGSIIKTGGGNRDIFGSVMVARFGATGGFLAPTFNYNDGSGSSNLQYDSRRTLEAVVMPGAQVLGIAEK